MLAFAVAKHCILGWLGAPLMDMKIRSTHFWWGTTTGGTTTMAPFVHQPSPLYLKPLVIPNMGGELWISTWWYP